MRDIGKNIRDLRIQRKLSQEDLAGRLFVTRQTVSNYETGKSRPDLEMLMRISETFEVEINVILYGLPDMRKKAAERKKTFFGLALCLVLFGLCAVLEKEAFLLQQTSYDPTLSYFLHILLKPLSWTVLGWSFLQVISALTRQQPLKGRAAAALRTASCIIAGAYLAVMLPVLIFDIAGWILPPGWLAAAYFLSGALPKQNARAGYLLVAFLLGAGFWLSSTARQREGAS